MENQIKKLPQLTFGEAIKNVFNNMFVFKGRSRRSEYWWWVLLIGIISLFTTWIPLLGSIISLLITIASIGVSIRRIHDSGHSGWWFIANIVIGFILYGSYYTGGIVDMASSINANPMDLLRLMFSPLNTILFIAGTITGICVFIFTLIDSNAEDNKYGKSPKYVISTEEEEVQA